MPLSSKAVVDRREISRDGTISVRVEKFTALAAGGYVSAGWHRLVLPPIANVEATLKAVDADLIRMGFSAVDWMKVRQDVAREHTPKAIAAYVALAKAVQ